MARFGSEYRFENQDDVKLVPRPSRDAAPIYLKLDSPEDFLEMACRETSSWAGPRVSRQPNPALGTATWDAAVRLARHGWPEGRSQLKRQLDIHALAAPQVVSELVYDYAGAFPDVPRFLGGDLDCMVDQRPDMVRMRPIVKVAVSPVTREDVPGEKITNWGAALVSWIDELEDSGRRVEVTWVSCSQPFWITPADQAADSRGPKVAFSFCLKHADQPVELDRLAFWIMHPAAQRRMQFAVKEQLPIENWYERSYGLPEFDEQEIVRICDLDSMLFLVGEGAASVESGIGWLRSKAQAYFQDV